MLIRTGRLKNSRSSHRRSVIEWIIAEKLSCLTGYLYRYKILALQRGGLLLNVSKNGNYFKRIVGL